MGVCCLHCFVNFQQCGYIKNSKIITRNICILTTTASLPPSRIWEPPCPLLGFPDAFAGKESACNAGKLGSIPGLGRSPGEGNGYPLQYSCLENSMDCSIHGAEKSWTWLTNCLYALCWSTFSQSVLCGTGQVPYSWRRRGGGGLFFSWPLYSLLCNYTGSYMSSWPI